ncbi:Protein PTHB1 [Trebouxia sp. C0010 RCD-2024]
MPQELCQRLQSFFTDAEAQQGHSPHVDCFTITYKDAIPLEELYTSMDRHWQAQQEVRATEAALADRAQQHRAVQKRLLMRFKDRQPSSIAHLDLLLAQTFQQLLQLGGQQEEQQASVEAAGRQLSASVRLILQLVQYGVGMSADDMAVLRKHLSPQVSHCGATGWEELTEASVTHLLSNQLAKTPQEKAIQLLPFAQLMDTQKVKKHISILLERLYQGASLSGMAA